MPELLAMVACTVNSYSRLIPGYWAPTSATWGIENRTTALRVIRGGPSSQRVEYRIAAADINPYIALAAAIGSGLWGIEHRIEPDAADRGQRLRSRASRRTGACRPPSTRPPSACWPPSRRARCLATSSSNTTPPPASGKSGNSARPSPTGNSPATSRSSDAHDRDTQNHQPRRRPDLRRTAARDRPPASIARSTSRRRAQRAWGRMPLADALRDSHAGRRCLRRQERATLPPKSPGRWDGPSRHSPGEVRGFEERATLHAGDRAGGARGGAARRQGRLPASDQARAARRGGGGGAVELSVSDGGQCRAAGADRRQCGGAQALASDAAVRRALSRGLRERRRSGRRVPVPAPVACRHLAADGRRRGSPAFVSPARCPADAQWLPPRPRGLRPPGWSSAARIRPTYAPMPISRMPSKP